MYSCGWATKNKIFSDLWLVMLNDPDAAREPPPPPTQKKKTTSYVLSDFTAFNLYIRQHYIQILLTYRAVSCKASGMVMWMDHADLGSHVSESNHTSH